MDSSYLGVDEKSFVNLTPHVIHLPGRLVPSMGVARCSEMTEVYGNHDGVELIKRKYGEVVGLPEPIRGVIYIVSQIVRAACPHRKDLASPGDLIRDDDGKIVGAKNLIVN